jgi:hypothetical protein
MIYHIYISAMRAKIRKIIHMPVDVGGKIVTLHVSPTGVKLGYREVDVQA